MDVSSEYFPQEDRLSILEQAVPLSQKIGAVHRMVGTHLDFIDRIAVAIYEAESDLLRTFLSSDRDGKVPICQYQRPLKDSASLCEIANLGRPRVINDLDSFLSDSDALQKLKRKGYAASYTLPMFQRGKLAGFIFFNSGRKHVFVDHVIDHLNMIGHLLGLTVMNDLSSISTLAASVRTATEFVRSRDFETGAHLERMACYARLIGMGVAERYGLSDEFIEHLFLFAPLHDIGKLAIPDRVLLKPGRLDEEEFATMRGHASQGADIIDAMVANMGIGSLPYVDMLRNIAYLHHEALDGTGYPRQLKGDEIPIEARIIAVADIFDALTSVRPYKSAWSNEEAFAELYRLADGKISRDCVEALEAREAEILTIQARCRDLPL
ncbi:MAG TPA: HD domain-containing phosphohydrolase [Rhodocyclaceae bacterium]